MGKQLELKNRIPILFPLYNNVEYTKKAVASLIKHTDPNLFEVVFIDNGSTDGTPEYLKQLISRDPQHFRALTLEKNLGFGGGLNRGLDMLGSFEWEYCVIANNDLIFTPGWLNRMLGCMNAIPGADKFGIVGPMSNFAGGSQGMAANYKTVDDLDKFASMHSQVNKGRWHEAGVVVGLLMLIRRKFIDEVGFFDERFFPGTWEENDLQLRGAIKGWKYAVDRSTFIHHYGSKTIETVEASKDQRKNFTTNRNRFRDKWSAVDSPWEELAAKRYVERGQDPEKFRAESGKLRKWVVAACRVKDGAIWMERTLTRVSEFADEIVILIDQATKDNTEEICRKFEKVVKIEREEPHEYNEAWSRNKVINMAFDCNPDWVYCFDADELIEKRACANREELTDPVDPSICLWIQPIVQLWNSDNTQRVDGLWGTFYQGRMFRVLPGQKIDNSNNLIHSGSTPFIPNDRYGHSFYKILHYGNVDASIRKNKYDWYTNTDSDKDLNMVLGAHKDHYWRLYYGDVAPQDFEGFTASKQVWKVIPDTDKWERPPYGSFYERDVYRHVYDEQGLQLVPYDEDINISLCMLVKDEAGLLSKAVHSVKPFIDELIVIDTGSTDGSDSVAERMGAKVFNFEWTHNFSDARNFALEKATGNWIFRIDPDEEVPFETAIQLGRLARDKTMEGYIFPITNWLEQPGSKPDPKWALSETCRLYKNQYPKVKYHNPVHEELDDSFKAICKERAAKLEASGLSKEEAKEQGKARVAKVPYPIYHYGYLRGREFLDKKFDYYYQLGKKDIENRPDDSRAHFNTSVHLLHVRKYKEALEGYHKTVKLDPKNHMALNDIGVIFSHVMGDYAKAEEYFRKALAAMDEFTHAEHRGRVERNLEEVRLQLYSKLLTV